MDSARFAAACARMPLFPLPRVVLMPGALLPLHVFEPRYRALVEHCLAGDRLMGIATLAGDESSDPRQLPPIYREIGVGEILQHQAFSDGRSNIVLRCVGRTLLGAELPSDTPFRVANLLPLPERVVAGSGVERLRMLLLQLGVGNPRAQDEVGRLHQMEATDLVDTLARKLIDDPAERRAYLGMTRLSDQIVAVEARLIELISPGDPTAEA